MSYVSLHCHTSMSNLRMLDSTNKLEDLIDYAIKLGLKGLAITDHESVSGHVRAIQKQKKLQKEGSNFKIILGDEIYLVDSLEEVRDHYTPKITKFFHFILLAKDAIGGEQIRRISSCAWSNSFYTGRMERTPIEKRQLEEIIGNQRGHIIASTACLGGELAYHILNNDPQSCGEFITWCQDTFGDENFFLEMQPSDSEDQIKVNQTIIKINEQWDVPFIVTTDAHYLSVDYAGVHEAYLNSRDDDSGARETREFYKTCYLMDANEIHQWMDAYIGKNNVETAMANTNKIADMVEFFDMEESTHVPDTPIPPFELRHIFKDWYSKQEYLDKYAHSEDIHDRYLLKLVEDGFEKKIGWNHLQEDLDMYVARIAIELEEMWLVTENIGESISAYYITTVAIINTMWNEGDSLVGPGRGSVAGMFTAYLIDITTVNPLVYNLPYWRHLSRVRPELADVDIDSQANRRKQIVEAIKDKWSRNKVLNSCTFKTEGPKSAILSAARGLGLPSDAASYIASLIPVTRGFTWSLFDVTKGNKEEGRKPVTEFVNECTKYPRLLEIAQSIEGLICGRSIHASAVFIFNDDFNNHNAMMRAPNGTPVTQFEAHQSERCSALKEDLLTVKALDKIRLCMDYLLDADKIQWQGDLKSTYYKYFHPDVLDYNTPEMWDIVGEGKVTDLFQFDTSVGKQAIKKIKPRSLVELATASTMMRLMASEEGQKQPMDVYVEYKGDINKWYKCMREDYHLTEDEIKILEEYLLEFHGVGGTQEDVMKLSMEPKICNFGLKEANMLRKGIAKKNKDLQKKMKDLVFERGHEVGTSDNMLNYFWKEVVGKQLGYSFSICHTTVYAMIALTMLNMYYHYGAIYWNCAALSINAGADEETEDNKSTAYGRVAIATNFMLEEGVKIVPPLINECRFGFYPDEQNERIVYSLKAMNGIGDDTAKAIIDNRPYTSIEDFCERLVVPKLVNNSSMISLIKGGAFTELHSKDRVETMKWWIENACNYGLSGANIYEPSKKLTMQQFKTIEENKVYTQNLELAIKMVNFKKYVFDDEGLYEKHVDPNKKMVKRGYHDGYYILDQNSMPFFKEHFTEDSVVRVVGENYLVSEKLFTKEVDGYIQPLKDWFESDGAVQAFNKMKFDSIWNKHASGSVSSWEMQAVGYYEHEHELANVDEYSYGIVNFFDLPEEPKAYEYYTRFINNEPKQIPKMKIDRIAGTAIASDNNHHVVTLLTTHGIVPVKFDKGSYSWYQKQVSRDNGDGSKTILERSWFTRGSLLIVAGFRRNEQFVPRKYNDTIYKHTVNKILEVKDDGSLIVQQERVKV